MIDTRVTQAPYAEVLHYLNLSIRAEQIFCSIVTQMLYIPQFQNQTSLKTVHRENYQTSYHRNTAAGNLIRLEGGDAQKILVLMTIECFVEVRKHDKVAEAGLRQITASSAEDKSLLAVAFEWHSMRKRYLRAAARTLRSTVGADVWQEGVQLAE
ncbi:hypothetical protein [Alicyclobacillus dauci]|uniref:Uncharacterized protein n=1 Tax=Alicyclobacillus dauci TaxID=1475485 RepID=A0ABY6Z719_9BACL|nr:hypothetical protein [Alicyclobacillus dauci]WAH37820.1 hypothetical protein NZD86_04760 [Alicyclobacillus dauci]